MRIAVIGAGGVGSMAAWQLAEGGHEVVAFERFDIDHDRGSSYGDSRIVRRVYPDRLYTALMKGAYALWDDLQARFPDRELIRREGGIFFGSSDHPQVRAAADALETAQVPYEVLDAGECARRFPAVALAPHEAAVFEPSMGYARASACVRAATELAERAGAQIRRNMVAAAIEPHGSGVRVVSESGEPVDADGAIIAAGPWAGPMLARLGLPLPLAVTRQPYVHLLPAQHPADFGAGRFPTWIDAEANAYGFPQLGDLPGVKLGMHDHGETTTPDTVDRTVRDADREQARAYAARRFPGLSREVVYEKVCLYTNTPDEDFVIDWLPGVPNTTVISGCSGHGFKFTPLLGRIAAARVTGAELPYDLSRFRAARFSENKMSAPAVDG